MAWERTYVGVRNFGDKYLVKVARPFGWKPSKTPNGYGHYLADMVDDIPNETYELPYVWDGVSAGQADIWDTGRIFMNSAERKAKLKVRNYSGAPDPHAYDVDKPKLRDGGGGGLEEEKDDGDDKDSEKGTLVLGLKGKWYTWKIDLVRVWEGPMPEPSPSKRRKVAKKAKSATAKKPRTKKRRK